MPPSPPPRTPLSGPPRNDEDLRAVHRSAPATMDAADTADAVDQRLAELLARRQDLTDALGRSPYDLILYLRRAAVYSDLAYPDLAAGDAYRALLLTDEVRDHGFEYHEQAGAALAAYLGGATPDVLDYGALGAAQMVDGAHAPPDEPLEELAAVAAVRCFQMLAMNLLLCGCLRSAHRFCERGLAAAPGNQELQNSRGYIETVARAGCGRPRSPPPACPTRASCGGRCTPGTPTSPTASRTSPWPS